MSKENYVLFYSSRCLHSKEFMQLLYKDSDLNQKFTKVNIDNKNIKIPPYIKAVPSIIVQDGGQPNLLVGSKIFDWYNNMHKKNVVQNSIEDWDPCTMTGYSDGFSYLENSDVMKKSYSFLSDSNNSITTPDEKNYGQEQQSSSQPKSKLDMDYENYMSSRSNEVPAAPQRLF